MNKKFYLNVNLQHVMLCGWRGQRSEKRIASERAPFAFLRPFHLVPSPSFALRINILHEDGAKTFFFFFFISFLTSTQVFFFRKKKSEFDHGFKATGLTRQIGSLIAKVFQFKLTNFSAD
jgi:hypothetical protein